MTNSQTPQDIVDYRLAPLLGEDYSVFHELISDELHIDVYCWAPTEQRQFWTLCTSGMNEHRMQMPPGKEEFNRTELVMTLPDDWPFAEIGSQNGPEDDAISWPVTLLKSIARLPKDMGTWLSYGTSSQAGLDPSETYPGSEFSGFIIGSAFTVDAEGDFLRTPVGDETVHFFGVYPIYADELQACLAGDDILGKLYELGVAEGAYPGRPSAA